MNSSESTPDRIAVFLPFLGGRGAQRVLLNLANGFAAVGYPVDLVLAEAKGEFMNRISADVRLIDLQSSRGVLRCLPALRRYLRKERPGTLLTAMDYINVLLILTRAVSSHRTKIFVTCHNSMQVSAKTSPWARDRLLPLAMRLTYRFADGVVAVSKGVGDTLSKITHLPRNRIEVIYNPVVGPGFEAEAAESLDHPWFAPEQPPVVLGVGSLTRQKDFETLIRAFSIARIHRHIRLVILGEGEDRNLLERLAKQLGVTDDVLLPGWVSNPYPYMSGAEVFVLSSRWEGFGLVLAEALACGTKVISADCESGPAEILEDGRYGKLVSVGSSEEMAGAILESLDSPYTPEVLCSRGRAFSSAAAVSQFLNLFEKERKEKGR